MIDNPTKASTTNYSRPNSKKFGDDGSNKISKGAAIQQPLHIINARVTYKKAPIHILEKFAFKDLDSAHRSLMDAGLRECIILQTCNRVEIFAAASDSSYPSILLERWASMVGMSEKELSLAVEVSNGRDVVLHLMKMASGLDSMVIGEDQILGQVRRAFEFSKERHYASSNLSLIFDRALKAGSRIRTSTGINKGSVSIGSMAVNLAEEYFGDLKNRKIMLIGTGEGATLVAKALKKRDVAFMVTSRTIERARGFAETVAGSPLAFEKALEIFHNIDLIFVATIAPYYLVTHERIESAMKKRKYNPMMIFDLSNPRTVEEDVAKVSKVKLINMDQIEELVKRNLHSRQSEIDSAEKMIDSEMSSVDSIMKRMKAEPVVVSVFRDVDSIRERELTKALSRLGIKAGTPEARIIEQLSYAITEGILSTPMNNLRKEMEAGNEHSESEELMKLVAKLFKYGYEEENRQAD